MLSMHTSPLAQPGTGDSGGMNVYVRELATSLAQAGVGVRVYVRRDDDDLDERVSVEPGLEVVHIAAGPSRLSKEDLPEVIGDFAAGVAKDLDLHGDVDVIHANYWLSAIAGHQLKHERSLPLISTFHTLARVKAEMGDHEPQGRIDAETSVIGCSDAICASNPVEARQLVELYGADPERIEMVPLGVDHAFFSPGDRRGARWALGLDDGPLVLFVGRIQPLKGLDVAVDALHALGHTNAQLVVVGGPSGAEGSVTEREVRDQVERLGLVDRVRFVPPQPHHLLSTYYRAADLCLVPSRSESFGLVALEAAACGTPVVASAVGGLTSLVIDGVTGRLIEGRDPAAFATAVDDLLGNTDIADAMGAAAAARALEYRWPITAGRLRRSYADLSSTRQLLDCA